MPKTTMECHERAEFTRYRADVFGRMDDDLAAGLTTDQVGDAYARHCLAVMDEALCEGRVTLEQVIDALEFAIEQAEISARIFREEVEQRRAARPDRPAPARRRRRRRRAED